MIEAGSSPTLYVDANPFVYAIEGDNDISAPFLDIFSLLRKRPGSAVTSELTLAEVLPKADRPDVRQNYLNLIVASGIFSLQAITRDILVETANYRRTMAVTRPNGTAKLVSLPDAIHVVTAIRSGCKFILSRDAGLRVPPEIAIVDLDDAGLSTLTRILS
jgi:predicted nucleic acid-binding protein